MPAQFEQLRIIIPTYNELDNLDPLLREFSRLRTDWGHPFEVVLIDDNSPDGTGLVARDLAGRYQIPVRVLIRQGRRSMGKAIAEGIDQCAGGIVCVMDADLSHPPETIPDLMAALNGADGVIASRYVEGGRVAYWPRRRKFLSFAATAISRILLRIPYKDPLSGFFLFRRSALSDVAMSGFGNKPLLEILSQKAFTLREVPYQFKDRRNGESKLGVRGVWEFVRLLVRLWRLARSRTAEKPHAQHHVLPLVGKP